MSFWGFFWLVVGLLLVFHVAGGWYFSNELIQDGFVPAPEPIAPLPGSYDLEEVAYSTPLGEMDAWYLPADGVTWVIHIHGLGTTPAEAEPLFAPLQGAGYPQLSITYRNDDGQPMDPSGYYQYGATEWEDVAGAVEHAVANGAWQYGFLRSRANSIEGGTTDILKNIIAERVLGLPKLR